MKIKDGGSTQNIIGNKIEEIRPVCENKRNVALWINDSLSYLTIEEALDLRDELNKAIKEAIQ